MPKLISRQLVRFWARTRPWNLLLSRRSTTAPSTSDLTTSSKSMPHLFISSWWQRDSDRSGGMPSCFFNTWLHNSFRKAAELASFSNTTPQQRAPARWWWHHHTTVCFLFFCHTIFFCRDQTQDRLGPGHQYWFLKLAYNIRLDPGRILSVVLVDWKTLTILNSIGGGLSGGCWQVSYISWAKSNLRFPLFLYPSIL